MQYYIGTKQVVAHPAGRVIDVEGAPDTQQGYEVEYPDGYRSWSPKDVFEKAYMPMGYDGDGTKVTAQMVEYFIAEVEVTRMANHTVVLATLRNGFTILADSACVDPANYDEVIGFDNAMKKIKAQIWNHLGFLLATARNGIKV